MNPVYFMAGLGLDTPILEAIAFSISFSYFGRTIDFLANNGFGIIDSNEYEDLVLLKWKKYDEKYEIDLTIYVFEQSKFVIEGTCVSKHELQQAFSFSMRNSLFGVAHFPPLFYMDNYPNEEVFSLFQRVIKSLDHA